MLLRATCGSAVLLWPGSWLMTIPSLNDMFIGLDPYWCPWVVMSRGPYWCKQDAMPSWDDGGVQVRATANVRIDVYSLHYTTGQAEVPGLCCCLGPRRCLWALLSPGTHILIWVACVATWDHGDGQVPAATDGHVWVCVELTSVACVTVWFHVNTMGNVATEGHISSCLSVT